MTGILCSCVCVCANQSRLLDEAGKIDFARTRRKAPLEDPLAIGVPFFHVEGLTSNLAKVGNLKAYILQK